MYQVATFCRGWENSEFLQVHWKPEIIFHYNSIQYPEISRTVQRIQLFLQLLQLQSDWMVSWFSFNFWIVISSTCCSYVLFISSISCILRICVSRKAFCHFSQTARCLRALSKGFGLLQDWALVCVWKTRASCDFLFVYTLLPKVAGDVAARFQSARSSPPSQPSQPTAIDLTDTEPIWRPLQRPCPLWGRYPPYPFVLRLQRALRLSPSSYSASPTWSMSLPSQWSAPPATLSPLWTYLCCVHVDTPAGSAWSVPASTNACLRRPLPCLHTGPRVRPVWPPSGSLLWTPRHSHQFQRPPCQFFTQFSLCLWRHATSSSHFHPLLCPQLWTSSFRTLEWPPNGMVSHSPFPKAPPLQWVCHSCGSSTSVQDIPALLAVSCPQCSSSAAIVFDRPTGRVVRFCVSCQFVVPHECQPPPLFFWRKNCTRTQSECDPRLKQSTAMFQQRCSINQGGSQVSFSWRRFRRGLQLVRVSTLCIFVGDISGCFHSHAPVLVLRFSQLFLQLHAQLQLATSPCVPHLGVFRVMLVPLFVTSTSLLLGLRPRLLPWWGRSVANYSSSHQSHLDHFRDVSKALFQLWLFAISFWVSGVMQLTTSLQLVRLCLHTRRCRGFSHINKFHLGSSRQPRWH